MRPILFDVSQFTEMDDSGPLGPRAHEQVAASLVTIIMGWPTMLIHAFLYNEFQMELDLNPHSGYRRLRAPTVDT